MHVVFRYALLAYFITHIPITLFIDMQFLFPEQYPDFLRRFVATHYVNKFGDYLMADLPVWLETAMFFEILQIPYFFAATYAVIYRKNWIRIPSIVYGSHVTTVVSMILADFYSSEKITYDQKVMLFSLYLPYLMFPFFLMTYMCFESKPFTKNEKKIK